MDKIQKFLLSLSLKEQVKLLEILSLIAWGQTEKLDMQKMKEEKGTYRVRVWKIRIVFSTHDNTIKIINIDYRWNIYK